jgi:hypothetical protein
MYWKQDEDIHFPLIANAMSRDKYLKIKASVFQCKQYPILFGLKNRVMASSKGYVYHLKLYCGREENNQQLPLGTRVVLDMVAKVPNPFQHIFSLIIFSAVIHFLLH